MYTALLPLLAFYGCTSRNLLTTDGSSATPGGVPEILGNASDDSFEQNGEEGWLYQPTIIHDFHIKLSDTSRDSLNVEPTLDVPATFSFNGSSYEVALHLRGNRSFRTLDGKPCLKIDFSEYVGTRTLMGVRRLTLNNMIQDGSMLREEAAYYLSRAAGVPSPRHGYARVWINDAWYGLYSVVETIDEQFLAHNFTDNEGNAYSGGYGADVIPGRAQLFSLMEPGIIPPYTDLEELITTVDRGHLVDVLDEQFNSDELLRHFAVEVASGQPDGYVRYANNFVLYGEPTEAKWWIIPWGPDQAFTTNRDILEGWYGELAIRCAEDDACLERFTSHLTEVITLWGENGLLAHLLNVQATIAADCEADPRRELPCASEQEGFLEFVEKRPARVQDELNEL